MNWLSRAKELRNKQEEAMNKAKGESRVFTAEEQTAFDASRAEIDNCIKMHKAEQELDILDKDFSTPAGVTPVSNVVVKSNPPKWENLADAMLAVRNAALGRGVDNRLLDGPVNAALGQGVSNPSDGGFDVGTDIISGIQKKIDTVAVLAPKCRLQPIGSGSNNIKWNELDETSRATGSRAGGLRGYWLAEGDTITASRSKIVKRSMDLEKLGVLFYATEELMQDSVAMTGMVTEQSGEELAWLLDEAIMSGSGAGRPKGLLNSAALVTVAKEANQKAGTIVAENIMKMYSRMTPSAISGAEWYINPDILPELQTMGIVSPNGNGVIPVYMPANGLSSAPYGTLYGRPVVPIEQASAKGAVGDVVFANMSQYMLIEKGGVQSASSIHVQFLTDQLCFRFIKRVNGMTMWSNSVASANGGTTRSPYVTLAARA